MSWLSDNGDDGLDESDVRVRPNPRGSRPRTKKRPAHEQAVEAMVVGVDRGRYTVLVGGHDHGHHTVIATRARELGKDAVVTGDRVDVVGDTSGEAGTLARVVRIAPRTSILRRSADDTDMVERVIVANADQMLIVTAAANPEPRVRLIDRYVVAAYDAGLTPILCVTKTDLKDPGEFLAHFRGLDFPVVTSRSDDPPLDELAGMLIDHTTVAVGHSGVGKSTLVNALVPAAERATGDVNEVTGRGRHTSSSTECFEFVSPSGKGWLIDTPGVRSFGLGHVNTANILKAFGDLDRLAKACPRGCTHLADAPDCAIAEQIEAGALGEVGTARLDSLHRLLATFAD